MKILAVETSCDETAAAVVEDGRKIISNAVASSSALHEKTGGIIPERAAREQVSFIIPVIEEAMSQVSGFFEIDYLAVTTGPGLIGSLLVGVETVKTMGLVLNKKIIPVNHVIAHLYANFLEKNNKIDYPALGLVISGGHSELFLMKNEREIKWLSGTLDDASGEAFDKTARILGLGFPGGPAIASKAAEFSSASNRPTIRLPRPLIGEDSLNFSFSGLKTAVLREVENLKKINKFSEKSVIELAFEIQEAITDVLVNKTLKAAKKFEVKSILIGGGVAANQRLTEKFRTKMENSPGRLFIPPPLLCTDNAAYIGSYAYFHQHPQDWRNIEAYPDLDVEIGSAI